MNEKNNYIITMKDGGIIDIATDNWCEYSGCETCGYGGWYTGFMEIIMEHYIFRIEFGTMYDFDVPNYKNLLDWFETYREDIEKLEEWQFPEFFKEHNNFDCDKIEFFNKMPL